MKKYTVVYVVKFEFYHMKSKYIHKNIYLS